jgi:hypothetical protein
MKIKFWQAETASEETSAEEEAWQPYAAALRALPTPSRPRDFFLSEAQAVALRPASPVTTRGLRRWTALPAVLVVAVTLLVGGQYLMNMGSQPTANFNNNSGQTTDQKNAGGAVPAALPGAMSAAPFNLGAQTATQSCPSNLASHSASAGSSSPLPTPSMVASPIETSRATNLCP